MPNKEKPVELKLHRLFPDFVSGKGFALFTEGS